MANATAVENQIDGDPSEIRNRSRYYGQIADAVVSTITSLRTVTSTLETTSDAVAAFAEIALEVSNSLDEVDDRYRVLAEQLEYFAGEVERLQGESELVQSQARTADADRTQAAFARDNAYGEMMWTSPQDPRAAEIVQDYQTYRGRVDELSGTVSFLDGQLQVLLDEWREIADRCADAIDVVISGSDLNDSWWDSFAKWVETVLPDIETFLDICAIVLTIAAFLMVLTGVGLALAPALFAIARGIQLLSKAIMVVKLVTTTVQVARGKKSPVAFLQLGVDFAVDKIGGKLVNGGADKLGGKLLTKYGDGLLAFAGSRAKFPRLADNVSEIQITSFDDWVGKVFEPAINTTTGGSAINHFMANAGLKAEVFAEGIGDVGNALKHSVGTLAVGSDAMTSFDMASEALKGFTGPDNALSGLAMDGFDLVKTHVESKSGIDISLGKVAYPDQPVTTRPSYDAMAAN